MTHRPMSTEEVLDLPASVPLVVAGRVFGLSRSGTYDVVARGGFPCRTVRVGRATVVPKVEILRQLGLDGVGTSGAQA